MTTRNIEDIYPLAPMQQGMLFHSLYAPESGVYIEQMSCTIQGALDLDSFAQAWRHVVARHPILRTAFVWEELDEPLQVVHEAVELPIAQVDWRVLPSQEQDARLQAFLSDDLRQGFDLAEAPLMRLALLRVADDAYHFVWTHHHLLIDGWCMPLLLREVLTSYESFTQGQTPRLPPSPPFRDYIAWLQEQDAADAEAFWRRSLAGFTAATPLVVDRSGAERTGAPGDYAQRERGLSADVTAALQSLARQNQLTLSTLVQGAWALLLSRYSSEEDVVFGVTVSGRPADLPGAEQMIGLFINTLPVRVAMPPDMQLGPWLRELQAQQAELRQYEYSPLVQIQGWSQAPRGVPLFESILVFENYPVDETLREQDGSLKLTAVRTRSRTNYPLTVVAMPGREIKLSIHYECDRFAAASIERMLGHLHTLLEGFAAGFEQPLASLPLLTEAERQQIAAWNDTAQPFPSDRCIHELFAAQVEQTPEAIAVVFGEMSLTYRELNARANQAAHHLRGLGVGPEQLVGVCIDPSLELIVAILGVLKAGGAYLPLDPGYPAERIAFMLEDAQPTALVTLARLHPSAALRTGVNRFAGWDAQTFQLANLPTCNLDTDWPAIAQEPASDPESGATAENLAYVIYTSGSTGQPKGVLLQHRGLCNFARAQSRDFGIVAGSRVLQFASMSFDAAVAEVFDTLTTGATLVLAPRALLASAPALVELLNTQAITHITLPPALLALLSPEDVPALQVVVAAGERCPPEIAARWSQQRRFFNAYGPTEATIGPCWYEVTGALPAETVPIGTPIANAQIFILDGYGQLAPVGVPGEIHIGGVGVARGYLKRPALTAERFITNPNVPTFQRSNVPTFHRLYKTGDQGRYLPDGTIEYLGRIDTQVKLRGFRVELSEIEAVLRQYEAVQDAAVILRENTPGDQLLVAYLVAARAVELAPLRQWLQQKLPDYMLPSAFVELEALPLTPNGKVDRKALPAPDGARSALDAAYVAPCTPEEEIIAGLWAQVLGVARVGVHDNFFELGGHSLLATQLLSRLREMFQVELSLAALFASPTVAGMAVQVVELRRSAAGMAAPPILPVSRDEALPLSFAQQRLWFLDQLEPNSPFYNNPVALRLSGGLDVAALERSLNEIVRRHETLRTTFAAVDGRPVQVIAPALSVSLPVTDLRDLPETEREAEALRLATEEARRPFSLAHGPLLRFGLLRMADEEYIALLTMHHIVSDGWSMGVLIREVAALYSAFMSEQPAPLPDLPVQYADVVVWQQAWLQGEGADGQAESPLQIQLAYWKQQLDGERGKPPLLDLPTDRPRPAIQSANGATHSFALPRALTDALQALSREEGATLFMSLLAAFQVVLSRYSGQDDFCVGAPIANRTRAETEGLIGFFVNTLVLRADLTGEPTFRALLAQVREQALGAYTHQDLPFEMLVEALQPERNLSYNPLFQVMFVLNNAPMQAVQLPSLTMRPLQVESGTARFDITLSMAEGPEGLAGALEYNTDLFEAPTIARLVEHLAVVLEGIVADPDQPVATLPLLTPAERQRLLGDWNATAAPFPDQTCFHHLFEAQVARHPDALAVTLDGATLTYRELNARANQLAHYLQEHGVGPNTLVAVELDRSFALVIAILGVLKAGGAFLPLDPSYPPARLALMLDDAQPAAVLVADTTPPRLRASAPPRLINLDHDWPAIARYPDHNPVSAATADSLAYVIYTSGSTGQPKGTLLAHRGWCNLTTFQRAAFDLQPGKRVLQFAALSFDASVWELGMALGNGATLVLARAELLRSGLELLQLLQTQQVTTVTLPPSLLAVLPPTDLPQLETVVAAGEACPAALAARWADGRRFYNAYGPTETTVCATIHRCAADAASNPPIGRPLPNVTCYVLDRQQQPVPVGVPGELYIGGAGVAQGYLNRPELTAERFVVSPFRPDERLYRTGDLVRYRPDGDLEFLGRIDQQVKLRGFRIELEEIAAVLREQAAVQDALVLARAAGTGDPRLVAYVLRTPAAPDDAVAAPDDAASASALRAVAGARLPEYMVPAAFVFLDAWPLTPSGKIDRAALPSPERADQGATQPYVAPRTEAEATLAQICAELLGLKRVGAEDSFFALGGHSLLATQLLARVRAQFQVELPLRTLFEQPTIAGLAQALALAQQTSSAAPTPAITRVDRSARRMKRSTLSNNGGETRLDKVED
jgi:amino acid adenylation domain-containing protein